MTKHLKSKLKIKILFLAVCCLFFGNTSSVLAQRGLELSVTPTLFEMAAVPGQVWNSSVKVINSNPYDLVVYAKVVNFAPKGESGEGKFMPVFEDFTEGKTLAEWITVSDESIVIPPENSKSIPFSVKVPEDASPGGHFAAIMVGTKPPDDKPAMHMSTSQIVTSLFFVRVAGDVVEEGVIREFTTTKNFVSTPVANFSLRFENKGNVHIQPQGQIEITNMWGKERGVIPINRQTHFGNVLPESIRKFEFTWHGEPSLMDIGRYKASVTLGYGTDARQFQTSTTYFWVVPVKSISIFLFSLIFIIWFISRSIKAYVRRMLALSGVDMDAAENNRSRSFAREGDVLIQKKKSSIETPILLGVKDLHSRLQAVSAVGAKLKAFMKFVLAYKLFFGSLLVILLIIWALIYFVNEVAEPNRDYDVVIENPDQNINLSSEEIIYESNQTEGQVDEVKAQNLISEATTTTFTNQLFELLLINAGDTPGAAAAMKRQLEDEGYEVKKISSDFGDTKKRTVVVYSSGLEDEALAISQKIGNALLSARPEGEDEKVPVISVYIGDDYTFDQ